MASNHTSPQKVTSAYGLYKGQIKSTVSKKTETKWTIDVTAYTQMQNAYYYGVETVLSGAASGTAAGYATGYQDGQYLTVPNTTVKKTVKVSRGHSAVTKKFTVRSRGKTVSGVGAAYSQTPTASITVTVPAKRYRNIVYNDNASGDSVSGMPASQKKWYGESLTLSRSTPTRDDYTFTKWNTEEDGTGTSFSPGATYSSNPGGSGNDTLNLHAIWSPNSSPEPEPGPESLAPLGVDVLLDLSVSIDGTRHELPNISYAVTDYFESYSPLMSPGISSRLKVPQNITYSAETNTWKFLNPVFSISSFVINDDVENTSPEPVEPEESDIVESPTVNSGNDSEDEVESPTVDAPASPLPGEPYTASALSLLIMSSAYMFSAFKNSIEAYNNAGILLLRTDNNPLTPSKWYIYPGLLYPEGVSSVFEKSSSDNLSVSDFSEEDIGYWCVLKNFLKPTALESYPTDDVAIALKISSGPIITVAAGGSFPDTVEEYLEAITPALTAILDENELLASGLSAYSAVAPLSSSHVVEAPSSSPIILNTLYDLHKEMTISSSTDDSFDKHKLSVTYEALIDRSNWNKVKVEAATDRTIPSGNKIIWDSINDVLGELICFGHFVDANGNNIYNIYRQVDDDSNPNGITIRAYAAIPDPDKELQVGYLSNSAYTWYNMSQIRIGFIKVDDDSGWALGDPQLKSDNLDHDHTQGTCLGGWNDNNKTLTDQSNKRAASSMYQYFRSTSDITGSWVAGSKPVVGPGTFGTAFKNPEAGGMSSRICVSLPSMQNYTYSNTAAKKFQQSPMVLWSWNTSKDKYEPLGTKQYIKCFEADGSTRVVSLDDFPKSFNFPVVTTSKTTTYFGQNTLRCVDPVDAIAMDSASSSTQVFEKSGATYLSTETYPYRYSFCYVYTNPLGHTLASQWRTVYANLGAEDLSTLTGAFRIMGWVPEDEPGQDIYKNITGVDIFYTKDDYSTMTFAGHVDFPGGPEKLVGRQWIYDWYGASSDTTEWSNAGLTLPDENTTRGPECEWMDYIDNRCYFYGGAKKHRLYIGGRVGHELCTTASLGGGWLDINPGSGVELKKVLKFKTYNGANIVTILASHANHRHVRRYNLIQNNIAITNELTRQGYAYEEVSNVVGTISHWGAGVWAEGLYTLSRYGLCLTTQQMENTNNLRAQIVSSQIEPVFTEGIAAYMNRSSMVHSDDKIYFVLSTQDIDETPVERPCEIIFCYDIGAKGWYTYTIDNEDTILSLFNIDYKGNKEGIGVITPTKIYLIPNAGVEDNSWPTPQDPDNYIYHTDRAIIETGELALRTPPSTYQTLSQLEFRFDYFIGDVTIDITGVDYYGRHFNVQKEVHEHELVTEYPVYVRVDKLLQTYNVRIEGYAHYRLTHILTKTYPESNKIDLVYGFNSDNRYTKRQKYTDIDKTEQFKETKYKYGGIDHHTVRDYNTLREAIVP